jgi:general secretion pathway protein L
MTTSLPDIEARLPSQTMLARAWAGAAGLWTYLVEAFCTLLDPLIDRFAKERRLVMVAAPSGDFTLHDAREGKVMPLGPLDLDAPREILDKVRWTAFDLRLPANQILNRRLTLPAGSADFVSAIVRHRLDRLTPWSDEKVLHAFTVTEMGKDGLTIDVAATSRDIAAGPLERLAMLGLRPTYLGSAADPLEAPPPRNLLGQTSPTARARLRRSVSVLAGATLALSCLLSLATTIWQQQTEADLDATRRQVTRAQHRLEAAMRGQKDTPEQTMLAAKQPDKALVVLINRLAAVIPNDTYLRELSVSPDKIRLIGSSADAPSLIGRLEANGFFNVHFSSPVTRDKNDRDSFEIAADRAPASAAPEPAP